MTSDADSGPTDDVFTSQAVKDSELTEDIYRVLCRLLAQGAESNSSVDKLLLAVNATNGYLHVGWLAEGGHESDAPDAPFLFPAYELRQPALWARGDGEEFDSVNWFAACNLSGELYTLYYEYEFAKLHLEPALPCKIPHDVYFRVFFMNFDSDEQIKEVVV